MSALFAAIYGNEPMIDVVVMTVLIGGACAALTGRALARTWRTHTHAVLAMVPLGAAIRFLHYALYQGELLSAPAFLVDTAWLIAVALIAFQRTRALQMTRQYYWLYAPRGPLSWRPRKADGRG